MSFVIYFLLQFGCTVVSSFYIDNQEEAHISLNDHVCFPLFVVGK